MISYEDARVLYEKLKEEKYFEKFSNNKDQLLFSQKGLLRFRYRKKFKVLYNGFLALAKILDLNYSFDDNRINSCLYTVLFCAENRFINDSEFLDSVADNMRLHDGDCEEKKFWKKLKRTKENITLLQVPLKYCNNHLVYLARIEGEDDWVINEGEKFLYVIFNFSVEKQVYILPLTK